MYTIFTNNPIPQSHFAERMDCEVKWQSSPAMEVLVTARAAIRQGASLVSDPLAGVRSLSPNSPPKAFNPYVSIIVTKPQEAVDFQSVKRIDEALAVYRKNAKLRFYPHSDEAIQTFQELDMTLLVAAMPASATDEPDE